MSPRSLPQRLTLLVAITVLAAGALPRARIADRVAWPSQVASLTDAEDTEARLVEGVHLERELPPGAAHIFRVLLQPGYFLRIVVEQGANDLAVSVSDPDGSAIREVDGRYHGPEPISLIASVGGEYRFQVSPAEQLPTGAPYRARIETLRPAEPQDEQQLDAERIATEGKRFVAQGTAESRRNAIAAFEDARRRWRDLGDTFGEAQALNVLGFVRNLLGDNRGAILDYEGALAIWRALPSRFGEAQALGNMAAARSALDETREALHLYRQAVAIWREVADRRGEAVALTSMSSAQFRLGDVREALESLERALPLWTEVDPAGAAPALNNLASMAAALGDTDRAIDAYARMLELGRLQQDGRVRGIALRNLAELYTSLGDHQQALVEAGQSLELLEASGDRVMETYAVLTSATAYQRLGESQKSLEAYERVLRLAEQTGDARARAVALNATGAILSARGDHAGAESRYAGALALARDSGDRRIEAGVLRNLGSLHQAQGNDAGAEENFRRALAIFREVQDGAGEADALLGLARLDRDRGRLLEAQARVEAALALVESRRSRVAAPDLRASYIAANRQLFELEIELLMRLHRQHPGDGLDRAALEASERARARALLDLLWEARAEIRRGGDPLLLDRERALRDQINGTALRQSRLLAGKHTDEQARSVQRELDALIAEHERLLTQIRVSTPRYAALMQPEPLKWRDVQRLLDSGTVLLEFAIGEEKSFLWTVTPSTIAGHEIASPAEIDRVARRARELLIATDRGPETDVEYLRAAEQLSRLILEPAVAEILASKKLVIVPDGILQYLPFAALPLPNTGPAARQHNLLASTHEIVTLPSASVLAAIRQDLEQRRQPSKMLAVLADPVFGADDSRIKTMTPVATAAREPTTPDLVRSARETGLISGDSAFPRLPGTRREAEEILRLTTAADSLEAFDFDASRRTATSPDLKQYRFIHFATHGLVNGSHPKLSGLVFSLFDEDGAARDGFLRLHDIYNLDLPVDLVVLSACQTGLGKEIRGEGIVGLTRGFMYAGAARVVVSLWKVDDEATAALMERFYKAMLGEDHLSPAAALRSAQVDLARTQRWRSPHYWAGFVLQGEPR